jgi:hypothetical protein
LTVWISRVTVAGAAAREPKIHVQPPRSGYGRSYFVVRPGKADSAFVSQFTNAEP